ATSYLSFTWMYKTYISKEISTLFLALSLALIFGLVGIFCPFRVLLQSTAEKLFLKGNFDYRSILIEFNRQLKGCSDLVTFCQIVQSVFREDLELASTRIFLSEDFNKIGVPSESLVEVSLQNKTLKKETVKIGKASPLMKLVNHHKKVLLKARAKSSEDVACFDEFDTEVIIPCLNQDNDLTCLILVGPKISQDAFKQEDLDLFNTLSNQLTIALDRAKKTRMAAEVTVAQSIQTQILPKDPELKGLELSCHMNPANEVGGDYYDVFHVNGKSWIVLGDVAGHGIGSGLVMFMVQSIIKTLLYENKDILPGELTYKANEILLQNMARLEDQRHMSILTMCTENGREFQVSGSHDSFYIFRSEIQEVEVIKVEQIPLGIGLTEMPREMFSDVHFSLAEKDVLFLGTDGITEAPLNGDIRQGIFEEERLIEFLEKNSDKPIDDMKKGLLQSLQTFTNGVFPDDLTFIIARANS
ncbi:MAG: serine phosphatase RsbU (regulator of sigma subunit), partial [Candidatus Marinamargulisbacteria bacterium]